MKDIKEFIKSKRETLSASSITTYNSILTNLYKKVFGNDDEDIDTKKFDDTDKILDFLNDLPANKRKTILSALVVITDKKEYRELMMGDIKTYTNEINTQDKSETQKNNWVTDDEIKSAFETLKKNAELLYKKTTLTPTDFQHIQSYIILSVLGGIFIPPRRSLDYCGFKLKNVDKTKDNYLEKDSLIFNVYKTAKTYGEQKVEIPKELKSILVKWSKYNKTDFLLFDTNNNPLSAVKLNQRLNRIFGGKKISVNALRHSYLSTKYSATIKQNEAISDDLQKMGSSIGMATTYIKKE
jgi:hypothetical protein